MTRQVRPIALLLALALIAATLAMLPWAPVMAAPPTTVLAQVAEVEPNNTRETAQSLGAVGRENPLNGQINQTADRDWFSFPVTAGRTYVVELFNVANTLGASGNACNGFTRTGMVLRIYNETGTRLAGDCSTDLRSGNVHAIAQFTASTPGNHTVEIFPNSNQVIGGYSLRILPKFDEGGTWEAGTFEPNNRPANAYQITVGRETAITAAIEQRNTAFSTFEPDQDFYWIDAVAGRTYTVELFNVANVLGRSGRACDGFTRTGLVLFLYSPSIGTPIAGRCESSGLGAGNVHVGLQFTAGVNGPHYIQVLPNDGEVSGNYSLRVLQRFNEGGTWEAGSFEPNQRAANAYQIAVGREAGLRAAIEQRDPAFSTFFPDVDWYRFTAEAGKTYVVELFGVANTLGAEGRACDGFTRTGMALLVYSPSLGDSVAGSCTSTTRSAGNVHSLAQITAGVSGEFFIQVFPNGENVSGPYSLRVLPKFDEGGTWDQVYEPNNTPATAYPFLTSFPVTRDLAEIETRDPQLATNRSDIDWYVFIAVSGRRYTVELLNVASPLTANGTACDGFNRNGMGLRIYNPSLGDPIAGQCQANGRPGTGIHTSATFTAGADGPFYIQVVPNLATASGTYTIRACEGDCPSSLNRVFIPFARR